MAPSRKPWHDSPYDASGMPLGVETCDYDNEEERRKNMVHDKYVEPIPLNDPEYQPKQMSKTFTGQRPLTKKNFNSAVVEGEGLPEDIERVDMGDPEERRELLVRSADEEGTAVAELPKVEKQETVDEIGAADDKNPKQEEHKEAVEESKDTEDETAFLKVFENEQKDEDNDGVQK